MKSLPRIDAALTLRLLSWLLKVVSSAPRLYRGFLSPSFLANVRTHVRRADQRGRRVSARTRTLLTHVRSAPTPLSVVIP